MGARRDHWAEWLLRGRFGGEEQTPEWAARLEQTRDRVLDRAQLEPGETLLDVGAGDGLIAFGALERGADEAIFLDVSEDLLRHARDLATELGVADSCRFVHASADGLAPIETASVDVVTTRSVLIYVERKAQAFAEFHRVLRPGGRVSIFEPINRYGSEYRRSETLWGFPLDGLAVARDKVNAVYEALQPPDDPMMDFDERDLVALAVEAGFFPVRLELQIEVAPLDAMSWQRYANAPGNPRIPPLREVLETALDDEERVRLVDHLRPLVERGEGVLRSATAYLSATKPS